MASHLTLLVLSLTLAGFTTASPTISVFDKMAIITEGAAVNTILSTIDCSDPDGDNTRTVVQSVTPSTSCTKCFEVLDCLPDECLQYRAGVGTLSHASASSYLVTVACEDNNEAPATEVIEIKVRPDSPPYFSPDVLFVDTRVDAAATAAGTVIYDVDADDDENDDIEYKMTVKPSSASGFFDIDSITGEITALTDLRATCLTDVSFSVTIDDGYTTVGPQVINMDLDNANTAPIASNLDTTVQIPEDATGTAFAMNIVDGDGDPVTYTVTSTNSAGMAQFNMDGKNPNIDIAGALDYEDTKLRQTDLVITATDGYCTSPPYTLRLQVTDVNEEPEITPTDTSIETCEGQSEFDPGYKLIDEDLVDTVKWSLDSSMSNANGYFGINQQTGALKTLLDYDVDKNAMPAVQKFIVKAEDKGGLSATATVTVTFVDCNDNPPVFLLPTHEWAATECAAAGTVLGQVKATDDDSAREQNNVITYSGSGGAVTVGSGGEVVINHPLPAGNVITFNAYAEDLGQTPGPLKSINPSVISVRFTPCPTTPPPTTPRTTAKVATTTTTTTKSFSYTREDDDDNLPWIIVASLLGAGMLGLLSYMLWRYGSLCLRSCRNMDCGKSCRGKRVKSVKKKPKEKDEYRPPKDKPASRPLSPPKIEVDEPEPVEPAGPGFLFGFWKERYANDDFQSAPDRKTLPAPGDMEDHFPHTIDAAPAAPAAPPAQPDAATQAAQTAGKASGKNCIVM